MKKSEKLEIEVSNLCSHIRTSIVIECERIAKMVFSKDDVTTHTILLPVMVDNFTDGDRTVSISGINIDGSLFVRMTDGQGTWDERLTAIDILVSLELLKSLENITNAEDVQFSPDCD